MMIIANPRAGHGAGSGNIERLRGLIRERGLDCTAVPTERPGHATELARKFADSNGSRIGVMGGDGTLSEVVQALERKNLPYAYLAFEGEGHGFRKRESILRVPDRPGIAAKIFRPLANAGANVGFDQAADQAAPLNGPTGIIPLNASGKLPGVLVIHENRGLNPYIEDVARRFAVANFVAFAPDGKTLASGGRRTVHTWDVTRPRPAPVHLGSHDETVLDIEWSEDGRIIGFGYEPRPVLVPATSYLVEHACRKAWRNLPRSEWRSLVGADIPYERTCPRTGPSVG